jgi:hypothetical protein
MRRSIVAAVMATLGALLLCTGSGTGAVMVSSGVVTQADASGDVHATGLSPAQRAAMDITKVTVTGAENVGVFVTVNFRGNVEQEIGKGALANAAAALILEPRKKGVASAGLVSDGPGKIGSLHRSTHSTDVGAFREGNKLTFFVEGPGYSNVKAVQVETVMKTGSLRTLASSRDIPQMVPRTWDRFISLHPMDTHKTPAAAAALSCPELEELLQSIDQDLDDPYFALNAGSSIVISLYKFRDTVKGLLAKCPPAGTTTTPSVSATFAWSRFSTDEVAGSGKFTGAPETFSGVKIILPSSYSITNHLCPSQLPTATITGNSIVCNGGTLTTGQTFTLNLQTSPFPPANIGGQVIGLTPGPTDTVNTFGPFAITGP